jgi:hypothetical protein
LITTVVPSAAAWVSPLRTAGFRVLGDEHAARGVEELGRARVGVDESGISYATGDAAAAPWYLGVGS